VLAYTLNLRHSNTRRHALQQSKLTVNEFIKEIRALFKEVEYKATSKDGQVFKTQGFDEARKKISK